MTTTAQFPDEQSNDGAFTRQGDAFQEWVTEDGSSGFPAESKRYHLYVSLACPWAHRTILFRRFKGLESVIGLTVVDPIRDEQGWRFGDGEGYSKDPINNFTYLSDAYKSTDPDYRGRVTVPVLWDRTTKRIVSNSDDDILRMLNSAFRQFSPNTMDFYPEELRSEIGQLNDLIYENINDAVYRTGFATTQAVYDESVRKLFKALDQLEYRLSNQRYLFGSRLVETDWRLFVTLIRFDAVYHGHFKCNLRRLMDYPNLFGYLKDLYQYDGVAETVNFDHIKRHYYVTHDDINPTQIVPLGPLQDLLADHGRGHLASDHC